MSNRKSKEKELSETLRACRQHFIFAGVYSAAVNILMLTPIIYMLTVYDRVISSGSLSTLAMLTLLMAALLIAAGGFEWVRSLILISASNRMESILRKRVSEATFTYTLMSGGAAESAQPMGDLTSIRQFLTGTGLFAFFDAPWFPIYVGIMFLFHPWFGVAGILAGIVMLSLTLINESATTALLKEANIESNQAMNAFQSGLRNAEVVAAMGMGEDVRRRHDKMFSNVIVKQSVASRRAGILSAISKSSRMIMQSLLLGVGAYLALRQEISPGMMIAGSLLLGRALAPIDMLVGSWKGFSLARAQYDRLSELLEKIPATDKPMSLPAPRGTLKVEQISIVPPGTRAAVVRGVNFELAAGESLGIVGPSASGKSTLARALLGVWPVFSGKVRLDGADISAWDREELGPHVGYLPQDIELFNGSIAENIARFKEADSQKIVEAAVLAGVHEMILQQSAGYDTVIGGAGGALSGGQRQRIGLARAVYGNPKLLVLDEPNSNLDDQGERSLVEAMRRIKASGCTVIVISHRTAILHEVDKILVLKDGVATNFGSREHVLADLVKKASQQKTANN